MFSTAQMDLIASLTQSMYEQGYEYYLVHTNTNLNSSYNNYDFVDLEFYFSKEPIECTGYTFTGAAAIHKEVISRNASNSSNDSQLPRISSGELSTLKVTVEDYEHIMTNAEGSQFMNCVALVEYQKANNIALNVSKNEFMAIPVLIAVIVLLHWFKTWFARNEGVKNESK